MFLNNYEFHKYHLRTYNFKKLIELDLHSTCPISFFCVAPYVITNKKNILKTKLEKTFKNTNMGPIL